MKKGILRSAIFFVVAVVIGCTHYSTANRSDAENRIHAPVSVVWEKTLEILRNEKVSLEIVKKADYAIMGSILADLVMDGSDLTIQLIPRGKNETVAHIEAKGKSQVVGLGVQESQVKQLFNRIKEVSEQRHLPLSSL